ncbi:MAG: tetratricopeptide repeat protein, partial [Paracoccaceae bacterium]
MRHPSLIALCAVGTILLSACARDEGAETAKALKELNVIDESNLNNLMLSSGDPNEAVAYFARTSAQNPERVELKRGLAMSLVRAQKPDEAVAVWREVAQSPEATNDDRVALADALIRSNKWKEAEAELNKIPPTFETYERYRLEAMVADSNQKWTKADSFYETAFGLTTKPSSVLN